MKALPIRAVTAILVIAVTFVVFLPALRDGFVNWDDNINLTNNPGFRGLDWTHLKWMWTNRTLEHYVPLAWMSFAVDYAVWGRDAAGYHFTNILLHALNAGLFFCFAWELLALCVPRDTSRTALLSGTAFSALLFSLHPLRVESVAWVTERRDVLSGLFYFLALLAYLRAVRTEAHQPIRWRYYWVCFALFVMSLLSKEITVTLPAILLILDVYPLRRLPGKPGAWFGPAARPVLIEKIPFFAVSLIASVLTLYYARLHHLGEPLAVLGILPRIAITFYGMAFYLLKTLVPVHLSVFYPLSAYETDFSTAPVLISSIVVLSITIALIIVRRRVPGLLAAWAVFAVVLLPVGGIFHNGGQVAADRYTYLSCLGWALAAGVGFVYGWRMVRSIGGRALLAGIALILVTALAWLTKTQIRVWRDSYALWTQAISVEPSAVAYTHLGLALLNDGDAVGAMDAYRKAVALKPNYATAHNNLGGTLLEQGRLEEAAREFRLAAKLMPNMAAAHDGLGRALAMQGKLDEAIVEFQQALQIDPQDQNSRLGLQRALELKQRQVRGSSQEAPR